MDGQYQGIRSECIQAPLGPRTPLRPLPHPAAKPLRPIGIIRKNAVFRYPLRFYNMSARLKSM
jgi:hypothetical protein